MQFKYLYMYFSFLPSFLPSFLAVTVQAVAVPGSVIGIGRLLEIAADCQRLLEIAVDCRRLQCCLSFQAYIYPPYCTHALINQVANMVYFTYSIVFNSIQFISISRLKANNSLLLVIASVGLLSLSIYLTLAILCLLYNQRRYIILIISLFSYNVFHHSLANTSHWRTPKTTKNRKNCTLISQQWLNNKFQNSIIGLLYLFYTSY